MKKLSLSLITVLTMSTFAAASGEVGPYAGVSYGFENIKVDSVLGTVFEDDFGSIAINGGYTFTENIAVEGRYWFGLSSNTDLSYSSDLNSDVAIDAWGIYAKPMYPVNYEFNIYALLGYGGMDVTYDLPIGGSITSDSVSGFSWGLGGEYMFFRELSVFVDYTSIIDSEDGSIDSIYTQDSLDTVNIGINYRF